MDGYVLGIDGGGTKTVCVLASDEGRVISRAVAGPGNYLKVGLPAARQSFHTCIHNAIKQAGLGKIKPAAVCAGLAGADRESDRRLMRQLFKELVGATHTIIESDAYITLMGATEGSPGVIVIAGTGSVAMGMNSRGQRARAGGWGHIIGDEGSGYDIGRKAIVAAFRSYDGRGRKTILEKKIVGFLKLKKIEDIVSLVYNKKMPPDQFAALYPLVHMAARENDPMARQLLSEAGRELSVTTTAVIKRLAMENTQVCVAVSGGVFKWRGRLFSTFSRAVKAVARKARIIEPLHPPEMGAVLLAIKTLAR